MTSWDRIDPAVQQAIFGNNFQTAVQSIPQYNLPSTILGRIADILGLRTLHGVGDITFSTALLQGALRADTDIDTVVTLLSQMAEAGGGQFRNFANGEEINFLQFDFSKIRRIFRLKSFLATNTNARVKGSITLLDSDGDGITDVDESTSVGTDPLAADTDGDGFGDSLEHFFRTSGADPLNPSDSDCAPFGVDLLDEDGDGARNCEERLLGTKRTTLDSDADGIPDGLEVRFGTNPNDDDYQRDLDLDGMPNGDEIRLGTDPRADDAANRSRVSYRYEVQRVGSGLETVGALCTKNEDCSGSGGCDQGYCRCQADADCSSGTSCSTDADCPKRNERCVNDACSTRQTCAPFSSAPGTQMTCTREENITCYDFTVQNITLVSPGGDENQRGWNNIYF